MAHKHAPEENIAYLHVSSVSIFSIRLTPVFLFRKNIMCPNGIGIPRQKKFGLDYVYNILNDSTKRVQKINTNPIK